MVRSGGWERIRQRGQGSDLLLFPPRGGVFPSRLPFGFG